MSAVMFREQGPSRWDPGHLEQFPADISHPFSPKSDKNKPRKEFKRGIRHSAIASDGSKAVLATDDKFVVYQIRDRGKTTPILANFTPTKDDEVKGVKEIKGVDDIKGSDKIKGVDISRELLVVATVKRLILVVLRDNAGRVEQGGVINLFFKRKEWSPTCLVLSHHPGATWCWVAVGGTLDVNLYLFRYFNSAWALQQDRPTLLGCTAEIRALCASPNFSDNPYASIFAGACDSGLACWNLRLWDRHSRTHDSVDAIAVPLEDSIVSGRRITSLTIFLSPSGYAYILCTMLPATDPIYQYPNWSFILPILHAPPDATTHTDPSAYVESPFQRRWKHRCDLMFKPGDKVWTGHTTSNQPYIGIVKNKKLQLLHLTGGNGTLQAGPVDIEFEHRLDVDREYFRAARIQLINTPDQLRIITIDCAGTLVVYTLNVPGLPGPPTPPTPLQEIDGRQLDHEIDGIHVFEVHDRSSADTHARSSTSAASGFTLVTQRSSQSGLLDHT